MPAVISHIIGTVALLSMMLVMANIFTAFGGFVTNKAYEVELDETASYVANNINQLIGVANFSNGGYLLKDLDLPDDIGKFAYRISIEGPPPPLSLGTTIINNPATTNPINNGWIKTQFGFESDNQHAEGGIFPSGWWNANYLYKRQITITNPSSSLLPAGYSVKVTVNTTGSKFLPNGNDLRVVYAPADTELNRINETPFNSADTEVWFQTQAAIPAGGSDSSYYIYYGYASASSPPIDKNQIYLWFDDFSTDSSSNYDIGRHADIWHGSSTYLPFWDPVELAVFFDTDDNFSGGWMVNGIDEDDVYAEVKMKITGSYTINSTNGLLLRWDANNEFYGGHISGGDYSGSPCLAEDARTTTITCISLPSEYHPFDQWFTLGVAVWDNDLKLWIDGVERVSGTDFSISSSGKVSFIVAQSIGWIDDFKIRKYRDVEPTSTLGSEESGEWVVYSGFDFALPPNSVINHVKVITEHFEDNSGKTFLHLQASVDGGASFVSSSHSLPTRDPSNEGNDAIDITDDTVWTASNLGDIAVRFSVSSRSPAELSYKSKTGSGIDAPKVRELLGGVWGAENELEDGEEKVWAIRMAYNPAAADEFIVITLRDDRRLNAYVCDKTGCSLTKEIGRVETFWNDSALPFDIEYEFQSGDAILTYAVYDDSGTRDLAYKIWDGISWSGELYIDDTSRSSNTRYRSIAMAQSRFPPGTNTLGLVGYESDSDDIQAWIWNGTAWGEEFELTSSSSVTSSPYRQNIAIAFDSNGDMIVVGGHSSSGEIRYAIYDRAAAMWLGPWTIDMNGGSGSDVEMMTLKENPGNDMMMLVMLTDDRGLHTARWNSTAWDFITNHSVQLESRRPRGADGDWEPDGSRYVLFYGKRDAAEISRKIFDGGWSGESNQEIAPLDEIEWITVIRNPDPSANAKILVVLMYESLDLYSFSWTGTGYENIQLITPSMQNLNYEGYDFAFNPSGSATRASVDVVTIEVSYKVQEVPPPSTGETYVIVVKSDITGLRTGNFTLPWNAYGKIVFLPQMPLPEGVSLQELPSGIRKPFLWTFVNSTHIAFGFGSR